MNEGARTDAIRRAKKYLALKPVFLDTETTGIGPHAEVVEICVVDHEGNILVDTLVKPRGEVEPGAQTVHGINDDMLTDAPGWERVWPQVEEVLQGSNTGIYNLDFDRRIMMQSHQRNDMPWKRLDTNFFCIMKLYAQFHGQWNSRRGSYRWQSLDRARRQCRLNIPNKHRAKEDTLLAREVLLYMANSV